MKRELIVLVLVMIAASNSARAWDDTGHMVVAYIARSNLKPEVRQKLDNLLLPTPANNNHSWIEYCGRQYNLVTIANWMDDLRSVSRPAPFAEWHYTNFDPVFASDFPTNIPKDKIGPENKNVATQIRWAAEQLQRSRKFDTTAKASDDRDAAYALAYLFHLVGDVHQPLHCATRYSAAHPGGDFGGNLFDINYPSAYNTLHGLWDGAGGSFEFRTVERPANNAIPSELSTLAAGVANAFPSSNTEWNIKMEPEDWVKESNEFARSFAFNESNIKDDKNTAPSSEYIKRSKDISKKRIAFAGYRLAAVVNKIFSAP